jgi:hypothetical protein
VRRINIRSRGAALLALYLFSDVDERSAPVLVNGVRSDFRWITRRSI